MKSFIRTINMLVILTLLAAGSAKAQDAHEIEVMETVKRNMQDAQQKMIAARKKMEVVNTEAERIKALQTELKTLMTLLQKQAPSPVYTSLNIPQYSSIGTALVVPAEETDAETLVTIKEDMNVMSRIFDKKLGRTERFGRTERSGRALFGNFYSGLARGNYPTTGIYLDDYGALFLMRVDFPLLPAPETEEKETKEDVDPVWEQTKQELTTGKSFVKPVVGSTQADEYDAEKIEELKRKLTKALKHATNIRNLEQHEWIILTITGGSKQVNRFDGRLVISQGWQSLEQIAQAPSTTKTYASYPSVLTIRATKADVDNFSNGDIDLEQFRQTVQIFIY